VGGKTETREFKKRDQFGPELLYFSDCVLKDKEPEPSGVEGLNDVRIVEAIYESAQSGQAVKLKGLRKTSRPSLRQEIRRPPVRKPRRIRVEAPTRQ